jgi:hypothetical protein
VEGMRCAAEGLAANGGWGNSRESVHNCSLREAFPWLLYQRQRVYVAPSISWSRSTDVRGGVGLNGRTWKPFIASIAASAA